MDWESPCFKGSAASTQGLSRAAPCSPVAVPELGWGGKKRGLLSRAGHRPLNENELLTVIKASLLNWWCQMVAVVWLLGDLGAAPG